MVEKHFAFLLLAIFVISFISAVETEIEIKAAPTYEVQIAASTAGAGFSELDRDKAIVDESGEVLINLSIPEGQYKLYLYIKKDGVNTIEPEIITDLIAGEKVELDYLPDWAKVLVNVSETENLSVENLSVENTSIENETLESALVGNQTPENKVKTNESKGNWISSTGMVIFEKVKVAVTSKIFYYVVGVFVVFGIFLMVRVRMRRHGHGNGSEGEETHEKVIKVKKLSELREAERRLKEAEDEVSKLKNNDRIQELEEEIRRLKGN